MPSESRQGRIVPYGILLPLDEQGHPRGGAIGLWTTPAIIGRRRSCHVVVDDCRASARHCEMIFERGAWLIRDLGATNGTRVNGQRIQGAVRLQAGDTIGVGGRYFVFRVAEEQN